MSVNSSDRRSRLRAIYRAAQTAGVTLAEQLETERVAVEALTSPGVQTLTAASGNGLSATYATPGAATLTAQEQARLLEDVLDAVDDATAALGESPTDAAIYAEAMHRLRGVREVQGSYTGLRC